VTLDVTGPAEHADVGAVFVAESGVGEVMDRQWSTEAAAALAAAERLSDPEAAADAPDRRAEVDPVQEAVAAPTASSAMPGPAPDYGQIDRDQQHDGQGEVRGHHTPLNA
jgi:hypothetical protein